MKLFRFLVTFIVAFFVAIAVVIIQPSHTCPEGLKVTFFCCYMPQWRFFVFGEY